MQQTWLFRSALLLRSNYSLHFSSKKNNPATKKPKWKLHVLTALGGLLLSYPVLLCHLPGEWKKIPTMISILFTILLFTVVSEIHSHFKQHLATGISREADYKINWNKMEQLSPCDLLKPLPIHIYLFLYLTRADQQSWHVERKGPVQTRV